MQSWIHSLVQSKKIGFLGAGNLSQAIISGLLKSSTVEAKNIFASNRNAEKRNTLTSNFPGIQILDSNDDLLESCGIIILAVKPQDLVNAVEPVRHLFREDHVVINLAAGVSIDATKQLIPATKQFIRWMPNTAIKIQESVIGYTVAEGEDEDTLIQICENLLSPLGLAIQVEEGDEMNSLMVACASGPAFIYEFMQIWESWLESYGFPSNVSTKLSLQTFIGSILLAKDSQSLKLTDLQNQIMSKKGATHAGLSHFRSFEFEDMLASSFEKAIQRTKEMEEAFAEDIKKLN